MFGGCLVEGPHEIYVLGGTGRGSSGSYCAVVKYDLAGHFQWVRYPYLLGFDDTGPTPDQCVVDSSDNVYFIGNFNLYKFDAAGNKVFALNTSPAKVQLDLSGNLIVNQANTVSGTDSIVKYSPDGSMIWQQGPSYPGVSYVLSDYKIAPDNSIYIAYRYGGGSWGVLAQRYTGAGYLVWSTSVPSVPPGQIYPNADGSAYLLASGTTESLWTTVSSGGVLLGTRTAPLSAPYAFGDGAGHVFTVQQDSTVTEYNSSGVAVLSYNASGLLGNTPVSSIFSQNGSLWCVLHQSDQYLGAARLALTGSVVWSANPGTTNSATTYAQVRGAVTPAGTTFLAGETYALNGVNCGVTGIDTNGKVLFAKAGAFAGKPNKVLVEPDGGFIVGGLSGLSRFSSSGALLWTANVAVSDMNLDASGDVLGVHQGLAFKVSPSGSILWTRNLNSQSADFSSVDPSGNLFVGIGPYGLAKISSSGSLLFATSYPIKSSQDTWGVEITTDAAGNAYFLYEAYTTGTTQGWIRKCAASDGSVIWETVLAYGLNSFMLRIAHDSAGNIYSVGHTDVSATPQKVMVFRLDPGMGSIMWSRAFSVGSLSTATSIVFDSMNHPLIGGWTYAPNTSNDNMLLKVSPDGALEQQQVFDSGYQMPDGDGGVGVDSKDCAYIFGESVGPLQPYEMEVSKFGPPLPNDAVLSQTVQPTLVCGVGYTARVTAVNVGSNTWTSSGGYKLDCLEPSVWGVTSVALASTDSIGYNQVKVFSTTIIPPATPGVYQLQWRMECNGTPFGSATSLANVNVASQTNFASFVAQSVPTSMIAGQTYYVSLQFTNTGQNTWTSSGGYDLISVNPGANMTWGRNRLPLVNGPVGPGTTATFAGSVIAPPSTGTYNFEWQPIQESLSAFGPFSPNVVVSVTKAPDAARFVSQANIPTSIQAGAPFSPQLTFMNVGSNSWLTGTYFLRSRNPYNNRTWSTNTIVLPNNVSPGNSVTFKPSLAAPSTPGTYGFQWSMLDASSATLFGDLTPNVNITVVPAPNAALLVSQSPFSASIAPGTSFTVTITMKNEGTNTWDSSYSLTSKNPDNNTNWGTSSLPVSGSVPNGSTFAFTRAFTAPSTPGTYHFAWRMSVGGAFFGDFTPDIPIVVSADAAQFISNNEPSSINAGTDFYIENTMKNTGSTTWSSAGGYYIMSIDPANNLTWGRNRNYLSGTGSYAPGSQTAIYGLCTSPILPGTYAMQWQMAKSGTPFGEPSPVKFITVVQGPDDAQFLSQAGIPTSFPHSTSFGSYFVMKNLGTATWDSTYQLVMTSSTNFGQTSVTAPSTTQGSSATFPATLTTPSTPGTYHLQFRMAHNGVKFGQATQDVVINVT